MGNAACVVGHTDTSLFAAIPPFNVGHHSLPSIDMKEAVLSLASVGFAAMLTVSMPAHSQERLKVLADTPLRPALIEIGEAFRRDTGRQVDFVFDASPVILKKLADGETADVLIAQPEHIADLIKSGKVVPGEHPVIGRVGLGLAARADARLQSFLRDWTWPTRSRRRSCAFLPGQRSMKGSFKITAVTLLLA